MNMQEPVLNAVQSVRPRGIDAPSATPRLHNVGRAPNLLPGSQLRDMAMDRNGKRLVPLAPRLHTGMVVVGREQDQAANDKRRAMKQAGI